jgi:hypothetical protein
MSTGIVLFEWLSGVKGFRKRRMGGGSTAQDWEVLRPYT